MKAFLSHSSKDKEFVRAVAKELGRQFCVFDEQDFATGIEFTRSILEGLALTEIVVVFASTAAIESAWVNFELDEAQQLQIQGQLSRVFVFSIDSGVDHTALPRWLQRSLVTKGVLSPKAIAREIRYFLDEALRNRQQRFFIGRTKEIEALERALLPYDEPPPRLFVVWGLEGMGRRTVCRRAGNDFLSLPRILPVRVESGDSLCDIAIKVADLTEPYSTAEGFSRIVRTIRSLDLEALTRRILDDLATAIQNHELPLFIDEGGLIDYDAQFVRSMRDLLVRIASNDNVYAAVIATRRPSDDALGEQKKVPAVRIDHLGNDDIKRLLASVANQHGANITGPQISELAEYIKGYVPAVYYAVQLVKDLGASVVLADKSQLVQFRAAPFIRYLKSKLIWNESRQKLLHLLALYSPLPLRVIGDTLAFTPAELSAEIVYLINAALIVPGTDGLYRLADPTVDAVLNLLHEASVDHASLAKALEEYLKEEDAQEHRLDLSRALFRALAYCGIETATNKNTIIHLASDLARLAKEFYHADEYEKSIGFSLEAVKQTPDSTDVRGYLIRALVQEERYDEAHAQISTLMKQGQLRDAYFLLGFLFRKRGQNDEAITAYNEAVSQGKRGVALHRELAQCYLEDGNLIKAREHIDKAQKDELDNRYIVDLQIKIATMQHDEQAARERLKVLEAIDDKEFYYHRASTVALEFGDKEGAYIAAHKALSESVVHNKRPTFPMLSQIVKCEIITRRIKEAEASLNQLERAFPRTRTDIKLGLRCKWEIARGRYTHALALWEKLQNKSKDVHLALHRDILNGLLANNVLTDAQREEYERQLENINKTLGVVKKSDPDFALL